MIRIDYPDIECTDVFGTCLDSVHVEGDENIDYLMRMREISDEISLSWADFESRIPNKDLYLISPCLYAELDQIIAGRVKKKELKKLYETYMIKAGSESRKVYDRLRCSAINNKCPFCGIRSVKTLDHYLPKSRFPMHSVNPRNLIPSCRDCNTGKGSDIFESRSKQTLYAYDDNAIFYDNDWVFSTPELKQGILLFDFFADPPASWSQEHRDRAINHFESYGLREVYVENSIDEATDIKINITYILSGSGTSETVRDFFLMHARGQRKNSFKRAMFFAVAADEDLCSGVF